MHWDYLLEEMAWLANDFRMEKKWKMALARKTARMVRITSCGRLHRLGSLWLTCG